MQITYIGPLRPGVYVPALGQLAEYDVAIDVPPGAEDVARGLLDQSDSWLDPDDGEAATRRREAERDAKEQDGQGNAPEPAIDVTAPAEDQAAQAGQEGAGEPLPEPGEGDAAVPARDAVSGAQAAPGGQGGR